MIALRDVLQGAVPLNCCAECIAVQLFCLSLLHYTYHPSNGHYWKLTILLFFRLRDLEGIGKSLKYYRDTYHPLDDWIQQVEITQRKIQENQPENSKTLATQLNQQKVCEHNSLC